MARRRAPWMLEADEVRRDIERRTVTEFGVFVWEPAGIYARASALRIYKRRADAERAAAKVGAVVRPLRTVLKDAAPCPRCGSRFPLQGCVCERFRSRTISA